MPNGDENVVDLQSFEPSWLEDGFGLQGDTVNPQLDDDVQWDTTAWTRDLQQPEDVIGAGTSCFADAGAPPDAGTWVFGAIGGVCQWIDTTDCA